MVLVADADEGHSSFSSTTSASPLTEVNLKMHKQAPTRMQRIPLPLQSVILRSNRGENVRRAPPENMGSRTFLQNIFYRRPTSVVEPRKKVYDSSKDKVLTKGARKTAKLETQATSELTTTTASSTTVNDDKETIEVRELAIIFVVRMT